MSKPNRTLLLVIIFILLVARPIFGQNGLSAGLHVIHQFTFLTESSEYLNLERQNSLNVAGGISVGYKLKKIQIGSGFYYSEQKQKFTNYWASGYINELKISLNYLEIPLTIDYNFLKKENSSLQILMGLKLAFLLNSNDNFADVRSEEILLPGAEYNTIYISSVVGISYRYNFTGNLVFNSKLLIDYGLMNIFSDSKSDVTTDNEWVDFDFSRNIRYGFSFGLLYYFSNSSKCYNESTPELK